MEGEWCIGGGEDSGACDFMVDKGISVGGDSIGDVLSGFIGILFMIFSPGVYDKVIAL